MTPSGVHPTAWPAASSSTVTLFIILVSRFCTSYAAIRKIGDDITISALIKVKPRLNRDPVSSLNEVSDGRPIIVEYYKLLLVNQLICS